MVGALIFLYLLEVIMVIEPTVFRLQQELKKHLHQGSTYVLAVSGGADSMALAHVAAGMKELYNFAVCHVEHGIRGREALADAALVESFCQKEHLPFYCCHVDVPGNAKILAMTLEETARKLRYDALNSLAKQLTADAILTAHHRDDQAETVLLKLLRGAGLDGLGAMSSEHDNIIRPWLDVSRAELEEYCRINKLDYCCDSTNADVAYTRNRVRLELMPYLKRSFNPNITESLARTASLLQEGADCLEKMTKQCFQEVLVSSEHNAIVLNTSVLLKVPAALRKRILRKAFFDLGGKELSFERTEALELLCLRGTSGKMVQLPQGITVLYKKKFLYYSRISNI